MAEATSDIGESTASTVDSGIFVRNATGLVRNLSTLDGFVVGFGQLNILLGLTEAFAFALVLFPGASLTPAFAIAAGTLLFFALVYAALTAAMPRSGGDYVWVSRLLNPSVGFAVNFYISFVVLAWAALNSTLIPSWFLPPLLNVFGLQSWVPHVESKTGQLVIGSILVVLYTAVLIYGLRKMVRLMVWMFWFVTAGTVLWFILLLVNSHGDFARALQTHWGTSVSSVIDAAKKNGFVAASSDHARNSFYAVIFGITGFLGFQMTSYFAGEIKGARRGGSRAILIAWALGVVGFLVGCVLLYHTYGNEFLSSATYLNSAAPSHYHLPLPPVLSSLSLLLTGNKVVQALLGLTFLFTMLWIIPTSFVFASRNMFAWSFDRVMPGWLSNVRARTHSPVNVALVAGVVTELLLLATIYTSFWGYLVNLTGVLAVCFLLVSVAAIVLPYRRKDIFEKAPAWVQRRIGAVPLICVVGIVSGLLWAVVGYIAWTTPSIGGSVTWTSMLSSTGAFLIAFPIYWLATWYHKRRGLKLGMAFAEIPPE